MNTPTAKQQEVLDFLKAYRKARGYSPSTREIQEYFGFQSQTAAVNHIKALAKKGLVKVHPNISRAVVPVGERISYGEDTSAEAWYNRTVIGQAKLANA